MGLFSRNTTQAQPPQRPATRTIPTLDPDYFESIHRQLLANGGSLSSTTIAAGVGNAIYNAGLSYLEKTHAARAARDFEKLYGHRSQSDRTAADGMIDFLVIQNPYIQSGEGGFLGTLLARLRDVLSRPEQ
jgi:hypothetical protein